MLDPCDVAERLREGRRRMEMTQEELAVACGTSRRIVSQIENGGAESVAFGTVTRLLSAVGFRASLSYGFLLQPNPKPAEDAERILAYLDSKYNLRSRT